MSTLLVLTRPRPGPAPPPEQTPLGRAALFLQAEGLEVLVGTGSQAWAARPGAWEPRSAAGVVAVLDRFPSWTWPEEHAAALRGLEGALLANSPAALALCRDKLATQQVLVERGLPMPAVEADPERFVPALSRWGAAFLKPRYGALGRGVRRVRVGETLPAVGPGAVRGQVEPLLLQAAVPPPPGWAALALRALVAWDGAWQTAPLVARVSREDPVANVALGAQARPAEDLVAPDTLARAAQLARFAAQAVHAAAAAAPVVELGVDLVVDPQGEPWLIEVNGRPGGRLSALQQRDPLRWAEAEREAVCAPLRGLARLAAGQRQATVQPR